MSAADRVCSPSKAARPIIVSGTTSLDPSTSSATTSTAIMRLALLGFGMVIVLPANVALIFSRRRSKSMILAAALFANSQSMFSVIMSL